MKRRIFIIFIIFCVAISAVYIYLNEVLLPTKIKALLIKELEDATGKGVILRSVKLNIFKGLVLRDLIIHEDNIAIINSKEVSCRMLFLPIFKKDLIISSIRLSGAELFTERGPDGSINIFDLLSAIFARKTPYNIIIKRISLRDANIHFNDSTFSPPFTEEIKDADIDMYLSLPLKMRFKVKSKIGSDLPMPVETSGEYRFDSGELAAKITAKAVSLKEFVRYYNDLGIIFPSGSVDCIADLKVKSDLMSADLAAQTKDLDFSIGTVSGKLNSDVNAKIEYLASERRFIYSGTMDVRNLAVAGIKDVDRIDDIKGIVEFDNSHLSSEKMLARTLGFAVESKINLVNYQDPLFDIYLASDVDLVALRAVLKDKFNINIPADIRGQGKLYLALQYTTPEYILSQSKGYVDIHDGLIVIEKDKPAIEALNGEFHYTANQLTWDEADFKYQGVDYKTSGTLTNFEAPGVTMALNSENLSLESVFAINGKQLIFSKFDGQYLDSEFSLIGDIDLGSPQRMDAVINGALDINLDDLKEPLKKFKNKIEKMKLNGRLNADFNLKGNLKDLKFCLIDARLTSSSLSLYDLKPDFFLMDYSQKGGIGEMKFMRSSLYGGSLEATGRMELVPESLPYWINATIDGIKIEKLKSATPFKGNDISGILQANVTLSGPSNDASKLTGAGKLAITDGKLWQLNLFRGLGMLLFTSDFENVIFREGLCNFVVKDKNIFTDDLELKSDLIDMYGTVRIDFDKSINASLKAEITDEALMSEARKNITTAIGKYSIIEITGTFKEPKYKFKPDVSNIVEDLKSRVFQ